MSEFGYPRSKYIDETAEIYSGVGVGGEGSRAVVEAEVHYTSSQYSYTEVPPVLKVNIPTDSAPRFSGFLNLIFTADDRISAESFWLIGGCVKVRPGFNRSLVMYSRYFVLGDQVKIL